MKQGYYEINRDWIRRILLERGVSFTDLAERSGLSVSTISRTMSGKTQQVSASTIRRIANALGTNSSNFVIGSTSDWAVTAPVISDLNKCIDSDLKALNWENFLYGNIKSLLVNAYIAGYNRGVASTERRFLGEGK